LYDLTEPSPPFNTVSKAEGTDATVSSYKIETVTGSPNSFI